MARRKPTHRETYESVMKKKLVACSVNSMYLYIHAKYLAFPTIIPRKFVQSLVFVKVLVLQIIICICKKTRRSTANQRAEAASSVKRNDKNERLVDRFADLASERNE